MPTQSEETVLDALVVGAGFSGLGVLHKLRRLGFSVKIYEAGHDLGGTWFWNRYPGARVDSGVPVYQLQFGEDKHVWDNFEWTERFPGREEIMRYFHHVDKELGFSKDIYYNTKVVSAHFDDKRNQWLVKSESQVKGQPAPSPTWANHLVLCTGALAKPYTPAYEGMDSFRGLKFHTSRWPEEGVDVKDKRVAIIGTGATGVQIVQEIGPVVKHLTVYQRTPNYTMPMRQRWRGPPPPGRTNNDGGHPWQFPKPDTFPETYDYARTTFGGMSYDFDYSRKFKESTPAEQEALFEDLWKRGGLEYWLSGYLDLFFLQEANDAVYAFWAKKIRARLSDPRKQELMAPSKPPHAWGTKRPSLEQNYYEMLDLPNVDIISVKQSPVVRVTPEGIETKQEGVIPVDVLIFATGFDAQTGTILDIDIRNGAGQPIRQKWDARLSTCLGISTAGFPNMYFLYGPQASTAFSNGPTCGKIQADFVVDLITALRDARKSRAEPTKEAEEGWVKTVNDIWHSSLFPGTESWYQGANIPGKRREPLSFLGGIPTYGQALTDCAKNNFEGFVLS